MSENPSKKDPAAVRLGRKGGKIGGKKRWEGVSKDEHSRLSREAANKRWAKPENQG